MSYDYIWFCPSLDRQMWVERFQAEDEGRWTELKSEFYRLYEKGDFVMLAHGAEYCSEELYLFERSSDAVTFYEDRFKERECRRPDGSLIGFLEVSLYLSGTQVATKDLDREIQSNG